MVVEWKIGFGSIEAYSPYPECDGLTDHLPTNGEIKGFFLFLAPIFLSICFSLCIFAPEILVSLSRFYGKSGEKGIRCNS